jgi:hypothetical protein
MIKFKAWNASNSRAIAKFHNMGIGHFGLNTFIHELIRGSLTCILRNGNGDQGQGLPYRKLILDTIASETLD